MISFIVPGEPVPQARPRVTRYGTYDPPKCREYKKAVALAAKAEMAGREPMEGAVRCEILIARAIPKSYTKGKRFAAEHNMIFPTQRPDTDNYAKCVMDALGGIVWKDDSQVVSLKVIKRWGVRQFVLVKVSEEEGEDRQYDYEDPKQSTASIGGGTDT